MSKVLTFSRTFPAYHPKAGQPTHFVEKIWEATYINGLRADFPDELKSEINLWASANFKITPKLHTIRSGNRWQAGDKFSPRVWSGKPYCSKQIIIAPDLELVKVYDFEVFEINRMPCIEVNSNYMGWFADENRWLHFLANNDGLTPQEMIEWFKINDKKFTGFKGQILCWVDPKY